MLSLVLSLAEGTWPQFGGDLGSTYHQHLKGAISSPVVKWQKSGSFQIASASVADVDGDGKSEVLAGTAARTVYCYDGATGELEWSFADTSWDWWMWATPAAADINGDGLEEVVICASGSQNYGRVYYLRGTDGALLWWATQVGQYTLANIDAPPKVGDLDGDGAAEVIVADIAGQALCLEGDGSLKWAFTSPDGGGFYAVVLADLNGDGSLEVILKVDSGDDGLSHVYVLEGATGAQVWAAALSSYGGVRCLTAADVDGDGLGEVVAGCQEYLVCYEHDGLSKWTASIPSHTPSHPLAVGDFDFDGKVEITTLVGKELICFDGATGAEEWSVAIPNSASPSMGGPAASDLDGDGSFEYLVHTLFESPNVLYAMNSASYDWSYSTSSGFVGYGAITADVDGDMCSEVICSTDGALYVLDDPADASGCGFMGEGETSSAPRPRVIPLTGGRVLLELRSSQELTVSLYSLDGRLLKERSLKLSAGKHLLEFEGRGIRYIVIEGEFGKATAPLLP